MAAQRVRASRPSRVARLDGQAQEAGLTDGLAAVMVHDRAAALAA